MAAVLDRSHGRALAAVPLAAVLAGGLRDPVWAAGGLLALCALAGFLPVRPRAARGGVWLVWAAWMALCAALSPEPLVSAPAAARAACAALVFVFARGLSEKDAERWVVGLVGCGAVVGAAALASGWSVFAGGADLAGAGASMTGILPPYYNYSAFVEAAAAAAAFACAVSGSEPYRKASGNPLPSGARVSWAAACALLLLPVLLSRSRGAQLGFLIAGGIVAARTGGRRAALALAAAGLCASFAVYAKFGAHNQRRASIWRAAGAVTADHPLVGEGPERFAAGFDRHNFVSGMGAARYQLSTPRAHSEFFEAAATTGVLGALLWLAAALWPLCAAGRRPAGSAAREAALAAGAAMTAQLFIDNMLQLPGLALLWASALGLAHPAKNEQAPAGRLWKAGAFALGAACLAAHIPAAILREGARRLDAGLGAAARERLAREAIVLAPASADWREALGGALLEQGRIEEAAPELERALELRPLRPFPALELARARARQGLWREALALCERALSPEPDFLPARLLRAQALLALGRKKEARAELAEASRRHAELAATAEGRWSPPYDLALTSWDEKAFRALADKLGLKPGK